MARVDIAFFPDFKSTDTLLIDGDREGIRLLAEVFRTLQRGSAPVDLQELPFASAHHNIRITARRSERDDGASFHGVDVIWQRSGEGWLEAAEKLDALATVAAGHQYLDALHDRVTVLASTGEYGETWWAQHG